MDTIGVPARRLTSLDAVRGLASLVVVFLHCYVTIPEEHREAFEASPWSISLRILHNGDGAVMTFFVLSGYVLALPFLRGTQPGYPRYLVKRLCRIYLPFVASIIIATGLYTAVGPQAAPGASEWFNTLWPSSWSGLSVLAGHFLMIGTEPNMNLNPVMWSLVYEMRISLIFPLLMILCRDTRRALFAAILMLYIPTKILVSWGIIGHPSHTPDFWISLIWTVKVTPCFITGILLAKHAQYIKSILQRVPGKILVILLALPVFMIFSVSHSFNYAKKDALYDIGAAMLIVSALELPRFGAFLDGKIPQRLGRISYSLYLVHLPILLVAFPVMIGQLPFAVAALAAIALSLGAATVMHITIEAPAIRLGHRLARAARQTTADAAIAGRVSR